MHRWLAVVFFVPMIAVAQEPDNAWHVCQTDADCVLVQGPCKLTGVNLAYKTIAEEYYKKQPKKQCKDQFWSGKPDAVKCHLESCQAAYN